MNLTPNFSETAIITESTLLFRIGKYRLYKVKFLKKDAHLITDHEIRERYANLHRLTNYKFIALEKYER